jgi:glycosyltransferase involved in cell wall biosynthesis
MPAVSVLMPVYNAMPFLKDAVASILNQTFTDLELIALDDASSDGSLEYLRSVADRRMVVVARPKSGLSRNLNYGAGIAKAPLLARMDADDVSLPNRLRLQVDRMTSEPELAVCGGSIQFIDPKGRLGEVPHYYRDDAGIRWNLLTDSAMPHPATMIRKSALEQAGLYKPELEPAEDYALWIELSKVGRLANLPNVILNYRIHPGSVSSRRAEFQRSLVRDISIKHLIERGYAFNEPEAEAFRRVARADPAADSSLIDSYSSVARRFLSEYPSTRSIARRKLLGLAKRNRSVRTLIRAVTFS